MESAQVDSICYHAGGNLGAGDLEDCGDAGPHLVCPQHRFRVRLRDGHALEGGDEADVGARQRVHVAYESAGEVRVRVAADVSRPLASDRFAAARETSWHDAFWREIRVARPVEEAGR